MMIDQKILAIKGHPQALFGKYFLKNLRENSIITTDEIKVDKFEALLKQFPMQTYLIQIMHFEKLVGLIHLDENLFFWIIDRQLGGTKNPFIKSYQDGLSKIELKTLQAIASDLTQIIQNYYQLSPLNFSILQLPFERLKIALSTQLKYLTFEVKTPIHAGHFTLALENNLA